APASRSTCCTSCDAAAAASASAPRASAAGRAGPSSSRRSEPASGHPSNPTNPSNPAKRRSRTLSIQKVGVVGCGLMGSGIAEVAATAGLDVVAREVDATFLEQGRGRIRKSLDRAVSREKLSAEDRDAALGRMTFTTELADLAACDIVIEAIVEDP